MQYPLRSNNKVTKNLRTAYRAFWEGIAMELRGNGDDDKHGTVGLDFMHMFVTILSSLTSIHVESIRDAATEAILSIARIARKGLFDVRSRQVVCARQIAAEKAHAGVSSSRYQAYMKNKSRLDAVSDYLVFYDLQL